MIKYTRVVDDGWDICPGEPADVCPGGPTPDKVDDFVEQWQRERPDLDLSAMALFARMKIFVAALATAMNRPLDQHGLTPGDFEVLGALRAVGPPCVMIPSQLSEQLMMSRAGITSRLDRLETAGLVERRLDPSDRRSFRVGLTDRGRVAIDAAFAEHIANFTRLANALTAEQRENLDDILRTLLRAL
ncbi:MarR family winged helix-turn-helix transcriptional regulator [Parafrankia sp. EUN1f]|uniref:MarR family winged helix-turn-helix transcriptional regulator n=1 Tax=Parafrankia sp. EUN1f TaxID=102897 RepID=UPI0001C4749C|nr:MarR family transcriptional regulator [Parafrankia sp. EUN1f]EFC79962.1 transcriptional regulator, MarR family [Parafrankia sp. EUN1f]